MQMNGLRDYLGALLEAQNYHSMFADFVTPNQKAKVNEYINWARTTLRKNDRIVWFLRWARIELSGIDKQPKEADATRNAELQKLNKKLGTAYYHYGYSVGKLKGQLTHFLGLPVPQIQQIVWDRQSPDELLSMFSQLETDWKETSDDRRLLKYPKEDEPTVVLQFPDGYAWFDLEKYSCDAEARAMGHCGNAGGNRDDTVLSLRRLVRTADNQRHWYPVLTFIMTSDGVLGEMKGRGNDKPAERYHPYIVALLRSDMITGIKGGGYLPEHNFKLSDLDDETREELLREKPDLGDVWDLYNKEGMTKRVLDRIYSGLEANNLPTNELQYMPDQKEFIVASYPDFERFLKNMYDDDVEKILDIAMGEADFQSDRGTMEEEFYKAILRLPDAWQKKVLQRAGVTYTNPIEMACQQAARYLIDSGDDWFEMFEATYNSVDRIQAEAWERLAEYVNIGWSFAGNVYDNLPRDGIAVLRAFVEEKKPVQLTVSERDVVGFASADVDDDYDGMIDIHTLRGNGYDGAAWDNYDSDNLGERRREENLVDRNGKDEWLAGVDDEDSSEFFAQEFLNALQGNRNQGRVRDPRQQEMGFESAIYRLKQLSGIY